MKTARVSSFTFACTTLAVALTAGASSTPMLQVNAFDQQGPSQQLEAPSIVLTPPTPRPDIGILRLPVDGMHTPPRPISVGTSVIQNSNDTVLDHTEPHSPPGAGSRPMVIEDLHQAVERSDGSISSRKVHKKPHKSIYVAPPHPNRGPPNHRHRRESDASFETTRTDSSGNIHIARVRDFVAKAEFRNRKRSEGSKAKLAKAMEFGSIEVVSSPSKSDDAASDLERVDVGLGDGLNVGAIVMPGSSGSDEQQDDSDSNGSKSKGGKKSSQNTKHPHTGTGNSKNDSSNNDDGGDSSSSGSGSGSHSGSKAKITWYAGHQLLNPACGGPNPTDDSLIAAVNRHSPFASCGDVIKLRSPKNGRSVTVKIVDWCDTCSPTDPWFDLTKGAFEKIADLEIGVVKGLEFEKVRSGKSNERRDSHGNLVSSILGGDFGSDGSDPASSLFGTLSGVLNDGSASSGSSSAPSGHGNKHADSSDEDSDPVNIGDDDDDDQEDCDEDDA